MGKLASDKSFQKTIKDYNIIRKFLRAIFLFNYRARDNYKEIGVEKRTYDDFLRRIKYCFGEDCVLYFNIGKKRIFYLKADLYQTPYNYLVNTFFNKALTSKSALTILILQYLKKNQGSKTRMEIVNHLADNNSLLSEDMQLTMDAKTIYEVLKSMLDSGLIKVTKQKNRFYYSLNDNPLMELTNAELQELYDVVRFYTELSLNGVLGYYLTTTLKSMSIQRTGAALKNADFYQYRFNSLAKIVDAGIIFKLTVAIREKTNVKIQLEMADGSIREKVVTPTYILTEYPYNRQYLVTKELVKYRIETIIDVKSVTEERVNKKVNKPKTQCLEFIFQIASKKATKTELRIKNRLDKEAAWMNKKELGPGKFLYTARVNDGVAFVPWLETFAGYIEVTENNIPRVLEKLEINRKECLANYGTV